MAQRSLASVRRHVFVCSEVCDGGALRLGPEFQDSLAGVAGLRLLVRVAGTQPGAVAVTFFLRWQAFFELSVVVSGTTGEHGRENAV